MSARAPVHPAGQGDGAWLEEALQGAEVVIFRSRLTDVRPLRAWLARHPAIRVREELMEMGSGEQRERFQGLKARTGWETLPQIFVNGVFVGGQVEFFGHPVVSSADTPGASPAPQEAQREPSPALVRALGYAGLLPFAAGVLMLLVPDQVPPAFAAGWILAYGAVIASFLGAVHWGATLAGGYAEGRAAGVALAWAVMPSLLAWVSLLLPVSLALPLQIVLFALIFAMDQRIGANSGWPGYYRRLRLILSTTVVIMLGIAWLILPAGA